METHFRKNLAILGGRPVPGIRRKDGLQGHLLGDYVAKIFFGLADVGARFTDAYNWICYFGLLAFWNLRWVRGVYVMQGHLA